VLGADLERLSDSSEIDLIRRMAAWPRMVETAAQVHEPHRIAFYLHDLASDFHALWNKGNDDLSLRFIIHDDPQLTLARVAMIKCVATVIASGLAVMGVEPAMEMR
jgi:arginyl-tRNA synthetase